MNNEITSSLIKRLMLSTYRRYRNGEISEQKAVKENMILGNILRSIEAAEQSERISALGEALRNVGGGDDELE